MEGDFNEVLIKEQHSDDDLMVMGLHCFWRARRHIVVYV